MKNADWTGNRLALFRTLNFRTLADFPVSIWLNEWLGDKSLVGRCQSSATEPSHNTFEFRLVRLSTLRPDAISSEDPL
jgi:hypothetical protein